IPSHMCNTFEHVILPQHPEASALRERILAGGGQALMSGSGPAVFGLFADPEKAQAVYDAMQADGIESHLCHAVSRI
ncbi:MAG: 4-(cytidine 5'-diphospho)-2-C-methyl-D-erythritol kinase, partial [Clostridia bacterium]|nr:4-(cytidine 5'-diphospho)-2-C-methyl-D-erythritol kinase [Clostridia bacterium]